MKDFQLLLRALQNAHTQQLPFVAYKKPNDKRIKAILQPNDTVHYVTEKEEPGFVFAPFDTDKKAIVIPLAISKYLEVAFEDAPLFEKQKEIFMAKVEDKTKHLDLVKATVDFIESGQATKVVVSRKEIIELPSFSFVETFERLLSNYTNAFVYVWYHPAFGLWLGATPETLVTLDNKKFKTVSLAGTQAYKNSLDVVWGAKELEEQQIVTDYIVSSLKPLADTLSVSEVKTVKAGIVLHLCSEIEGSLKTGINIAELIHIIHPTPAVCGLPTDIAKTFILAHEGYAREFYTGFLGEIHVENKTNLYVNLRCMKHEAPNVALFLGGGITKDSTAIKEYNETVEKSKVLKKVL